MLAEIQDTTIQAQTANLYQFQSQFRSSRYPNLTMPSESVGISLQTPCL